MITIGNNYVLVTLFDYYYVFWDCGSIFLRESQVYDTPGIGDHKTNRLDDYVSVGLLNVPGLLYQFLSHKSYELETQIENLYKKDRLPF